MRITITARHTEIDDDLRAHTRELVEKVVKLARRPHHAQVVFTGDHGEAAVEIAVHVPRGRIHVAKSQAADLLACKGDPLQLELLTAEVGLDREIRSPEASSPGLVLAGYTARFVGTDRLHILGETEITYLASLDVKARGTAIQTFLSYDL